MLQKVDYYPFGLDIKRYEAIPNKYLYNNKEKQEEMAQYDYGARFYDPVIGRWHTADQLADNYYRVSSYVYVLNRPTVAIDPDGKRVYFIGGAGNDQNGWNYINRWGQAFKRSGINDFIRVNASYGTVGDMMFTTNYRNSGTEYEYIWRKEPGEAMYKEYTGRELPIDNSMINSTAELYRSQLKDNPLQEGEQFNLAGYSYGSVLQAQVALKLAKSGQVIDNLVLIGSPISDKSKLMKQLKGNKNIKNITRYDIKGDHLSNPKDIQEFLQGIQESSPKSVGGKGDDAPHFDAARPGQAADKLIQTIVDWLRQQGVKN